MSVMVSCPVEPVCDGVRWFSVDTRPDLGVWDYFHYGGPVTLKCPDSISALITFLTHSQDDLQPPSDHTRSRVWVQPEYTLACRWRLRGWLARNNVSGACLLFPTDCYYHEDVWRRSVPPQYCLRMLLAINAHAGQSIITYFLCQMTTKRRTLVIGAEKSERGNNWKTK